MLILRFIAWCLVHIYEAACWLCLALWIASLFVDRFGHTTRRDD